MKLTFLWQDSAYNEREWIANIFSSVADEQITDGDHSIVRDNCLLIDSYLYSHSSDYYAQFRGKNAWLLHLSDETYEGGYDMYRNFRGVFRNYWSPAFNPRRVLQFPLGYSPGFERERGEPGIEQRSKLWSFLGEANKSSRVEMIEALTPLRPSLVHCTDRGQFKPMGTEDYMQVLRDSIFVPCPMGNVNLDSFRVYEALQCGAIPVLERRATLDYFTQMMGSHPLPTFADWNQAARFMAGLRDDPQALNSLQAKCIQWWLDYKMKLSSQIESFLAVPAEQASGGFASWTCSLPGWQFTQLLRQQNMQSFSRRVRLQCKRLLGEGRLRKTYGK